MWTTSRISLAASCVQSWLFYHIGLMTPLTSFPAFWQKLQWEVWKPPTTKIASHFMTFWQHVIEVFFSIFYYILLTKQKAMKAWYSAPFVISVQDSPSHSLLPNICMSCSKLHPWSRLWFPWQWTVTRQTLHCCNQSGQWQLLLIPAKCHVDSVIISSWADRQQIRVNISEQKAILSVHHMELIISHKTRSPCNNRLQSVVQIYTHFHLQY